MAIIPVSTTIEKRAPDGYDDCRDKDRGEERYPVQEGVSGEVNAQDADDQKNGDEADQNGSNNAQWRPAASQKLTEKPDKRSNLQPDDQSTKRNNHCESSPSIHLCSS